jgi:putative membrane protein
MIDDHRSAEGKVGSLAAEKGVALPSKLDSAHQDMVDDLKTKSGLEFDKAFIDDQVKAHKDTIEADKDEANSGTDPQVRALAGDLLGTLRMHLSMAEKLQNGM